MGHRQNYPKDWRLDAQFVAWCVAGLVLAVALAWAIVTILMTLSTAIRS